MKYFTKIPLPLPIRAKHIFPILSMLLFFFFFFFFFFSLNSRNSITVIPIHINLVSEQVSFKARESSSNFCVNPFTTGVPIVIDLGHTLV